MSVTIFTTSIFYADDSYDVDSKYTDADNDADNDNEEVGDVEITTLSSEAQTRPSSGHSSPETA